MPACLPWFVLWGSVRREISGRLGVRSRWPWRSPPEKRAWRWRQRPWGRRQRASSSGPEPLGEWRSRPHCCRVGPGVRSRLDLPLPIIKPIPMSRPLRIEYPGVWYHIMNRCRGLIRWTNHTYFPELLSSTRILLKASSRVRISASDRLRAIRRYQPQQRQVCYATSARESEAASVCDNDNPGRVIRTGCKENRRIIWKFASKPFSFCDQPVQFRPGQYQEEELWKAQERVQLLEHPQCRNS